MKPIKIGIVMDPIESIKAYKDSSLAMLLEAKARGWQIFYMQMGDLFMQSGKAMANGKILDVFDDKQHWFDFLSEKQTIELSSLDAILMRKDPPFDMHYIYATYILEYAEKKGCLIVNKPQSLRDANEKMFTLGFEQCIVPTLVTSNAKQIKDFIQQHQDIIIKPLDGMGGASIFRMQLSDPNNNVIIETLTHYETEYAMVQRFIPEITAGDKRILIIDGTPVEYALARIPTKDENRGNIAAGGTGKGIPLSKRDYWLCEQIKPVLQEKGLIFVGLDVIGDYITEINVTSPTCIRELDSQFGLNISGLLMDVIEQKCIKS
ncbi:MAG: glutathione synthase [Pseudomonadota bacterium]